ncbi:unnamed protein product [Coccothraustes coccothraustes]
MTTENQSCATQQSNPRCKKSRSGAKAEHDVCFGEEKQQRIERRQAQRVRNTEGWQRLSGGSDRNRARGTKTLESLTRPRQQCEMAPGGVRHLGADKAPKECFFSP